MIMAKRSALPRAALARTAPAHWQASARVTGGGEVDEDRVQRAGRADEQVVAFRAAEGEVGHDLGDVQLAEQRAVRVETVQPIRGRRPDAAPGVEADAIEVAGVAGR